MKNALIAEFIGTFFLYLIIGMCVTPPGAAPLTPLAVGFGLTALVYSCGHLSKAHFNPATTITYLCAGSHSVKAAIPYAAVIFAAAIAAALCISVLNPEGLEKVVEPFEVDYAKVIIAEFLFTFALMWVILNVAISNKTAGNQFYGIAIGGIVAAGAYAVGPISFAAFNPAVTVALAINGFLPWNAVPIYIGIQAAAAALAGVLFKSMGTTNENELSDKPWN